MSSQELAPLLFEKHEVDDEPALRGTVVFSLAGEAFFASADGTLAVSLDGRKARLERGAAHPAQAHHKESIAVPVGGVGALVLLTDDRKRIEIAWYDRAKKDWTALERPIGFVPRGHVVVGQTIVFPQASRAPAWFVFDAATRRFARVARPDGVPACAGAVFAHDGGVAVAGLDAAKKRCAISYSPAGGTWSTLPSPPVAPGEHVAQHGGQTTFLGAAMPTLSFDGKAWETLPAPTRLGARDVVAATARGVTIWGVQKGTLYYQALDPRIGKWSSMTEPRDLVVRSVVALDEGRWVVHARTSGKPVLFEVANAPGASPTELAANRAALGPAKHEDRDWKTASDEERRAAIEKGLGAVERYVPPERDASGKVTTHGAWVFALGEELYVWPVPPKQCAKFIERMIARWPTESVGSEWKVERGAGFARAGKRLLYGPSGQCRDTQKCATDYYSERATPLSQIGFLFSYALQTSQARDCGAPVSTEHWATIDLRDGKPAPLTAVIDGDQILAALKSHKTLRAKLDAATALDEAVATLRRVDPRALVGYAFGGWRSATRQVELRLEYHPNGPDHVEAIRIWVEPRPEFVETFEAAARTAGLFMGTSK